jgi:hypothetical protein
VEEDNFFNAINQFVITYVEYSPYITRYISDVRLQTEAVVGDRMGYALHFTNSQTGFGAFSKSIFVYRYVCKNGAVSSFGKTFLTYHRLGSFMQFCSNLSDFEDLFEGVVQDLDRGLMKTRTIKYNKNLSPIVKSLISPALSVYETKEMMDQLEGCNNIWEVYDHLTTSAKTPDLYKNFLLQEAAGNIISRFGRKAEVEDDLDKLF